MRDGPGAKPAVVYLFDFLRNSGILRGRNSKEQRKNVFFGMMFLGWLPFVLLFLFIVAIQGVLRALGIFRKHGADQLGGRRPHDGFRTVNFEDLAGRGPFRPSLESRIFRLAARLGGRVTISDVVIETDFPVAEAEQLMDHLVDGSHVRMEVTDEGMVVYEFPEIMARNEPGGSE